jgi:hypothetical protein
LLEDNFADLAAQLDHLWLVNIHSANAMHIERVRDKVNKKLQLALTVKAPVIQLQVALVGEVQYEVY